MQVRILSREHVDILWAYISMAERAADYRHISVRFPRCLPIFLILPPMEYNRSMKYFGKGTLQ